MGLYLNGIKIGMPYINGVKHNAYLNGQKIWISGPAPAPSDDGVFSFTVADNGSFAIPVAGVNGSSTTYQSFAWRIDWGDGSAIQTVSGTSSSANTINNSCYAGLT